MTLFDVFIGIVIGFIAVSFGIELAKLLEFLFETRYRQVQDYLKKWLLGDTP